MIWGDNALQMCVFHGAKMPKRDCTGALQLKSHKHGGGFKYFLFSSLLGEDFQFD